MSEGNRVRLSYAPQADYDTDPGAVAYTAIRRTGGKFDAPTDFVQSNEVRDDRKVAAQIAVHRSANGTLEFELPYGSHDALFAGLLFSTWTAAVNISGTDISFVAATQSIHSGGVANLSGLTAHQVIRVAGAAEANNTGVFELTSNSTATDIFLLTGSGITDAAVGPTITIENDGTLRDGTTATYFAFEEEYLDVSPLVVLKFVSMLAGGGKLSIPDSGLITGSIDFNGKDVQELSAVTRGSLVAANSNLPFNSTSNITDMREGAGLGAEIEDIVSKIEFSVNNNLRNNKGVGSFNPRKILPGTSNVEGTLEIFYQGGTLLGKYLARTESKLRFRVWDAATLKGYVITFPRFVYTGGIPDTGALNTDTMQTLPFKCFAHAVTGAQVQIDRFSA